MTKTDDEVLEGRGMDRSWDMLPADFRLVTFLQDGKYRVWRPKECQSWTHERIKEFIHGKAVDVPEEEITDAA